MKKLLVINPTCFQLKVRDIVIKPHHEAVDGQIIRVASTECDDVMRIITSNSMTVTTVEKEPLSVNSNETDSDDGKIDLDDAAKKAAEKKAKSEAKKAAEDAKNNGSK